MLGNHIFWDPLWLTLRQRRSSKRCAEDLRSLRPTSPACVSMRNRRKVRGTIMLLSPKLLRVPISNDRYLACAAAVEAVKKLEAELSIARQEASKSKAAANKADADLQALKTTSGQFEARVAEVEKDLQETIVKYEALEEKRRNRMVKSPSLPRLGRKA